MKQAERQRRWYVNLTAEQRAERRLRQRVGFDHSETMSPEVRSARAQHAVLSMTYEQRRVNAYDAGCASARAWRKHERAEIAGQLKEIRAQIAVLEDT